jgi:hypothetical protein
MEIQTIGTCSSASSTQGFYKKKKRKKEISNFGGISKFFKLIVFGQFWVDFVA